MAIRDDLIEALNACIERTNTGETLDSILQDYPQMAQQLRVLMEAGRSVQRGRFDAGIVENVRLKSESQIQEAINTPPSSSAFSLNLWLPLLIAGGILVGIIFNAANQNPNTALPSQEASPINLTTEIEASAEVLEATEESFSPTATPSEDSGAVITVIEGPVEAIIENSIFIYGTEIVLEENDPNLSVMQVGDMLRIEGFDDGARLLVITIIFTNVEVYVFEGMVWRDNGDCSNPPPAWATASVWHERCEGGAPPVSDGGVLPEGCRYTGYGRGYLSIKCSRS